MGGIATEQSASMTANADIWQHVTKVMTPTEDGVIEVWVEAQGGTTYSLYIDDFEVV